MKTIKYIIAGAVLAGSMLGGLSLTSCSDLDEHGYTFIDPASFYNTEEEIDATLVGVYNRYRNMYNANSQLYLAQIELLADQAYLAQIELLADQAVPTYNKNNMELINKWDGVQNASASNGVHRIWAACYEAVNRANIVLGRVDNVEMSEESRNRIKGQAYFLRGYAFYSMARCFGALALPLTYTNGVENLEIARSTYSETYDQIISDLKQAESLLPVRGTSGYDVWRASKGAAQAALGEVYLHRAGLADVFGEGANETEYYTQARDYSKKVIDSGVYGLMDNYEDQFYWFNESGAKNNKESIFELQYSAAQSQSNGMHIRFGLGRTYSNYMGCYQYSRMGVSPYIYTEMLANGDKRAKVFLTYFEENDGTAHTFNPTTLHWEPYITNDRNVEHTCVFNCKYFDQHTDASLQRPNANFPILRYAESTASISTSTPMLRCSAPMPTSPSCAMLRCSSTMPRLPTSSMPARASNASTRCASVLDWLRSAAARLRLTRRSSTSVASSSWAKARFSLLNCVATCLPTVRPRNLPRALPTSSATSILPNRSSSPARTSFS